MIEILRKHVFVRDERGATATEYALLVGFIALALIAGVTIFGTSLNDTFDGFSSRVTALN